MFQFDYRTRHFPDTDDAQNMYPSPPPVLVVPPHSSPVHGDTFTACNAQHTVLTGSSFPFSHFVSSHPPVIPSITSTNTPSSEAEQQQVMFHPAGSTTPASDSQHHTTSTPATLPSPHPPPSRLPTTPIVTKSSTTTVPHAGANSFKTGQGTYSYAKRARMDARNQRRRDERARARGRLPRASEPSAGASTATTAARAREWKAALMVGGLGGARNLLRLAIKRKREEEEEEEEEARDSRFSGKGEGEEGAGAGARDLDALSLSSLGNATDTRRASVRVVARATAPAASASSLGLSGSSNLSAAPDAGGEDEDLGTENDTEDDGEYAPARALRRYTGAGSGTGVARSGPSSLRSAFSSGSESTTSVPSSAAMAPSLPPPTVSVPMPPLPPPTSRAASTSSSRGRRPHIPHSSRASDYQDNSNPNMTNPGVFGFWTDAKKITLFMYYLGDTEPSVEARRAMADEVGLETSQVSKFMSRTRSEIARGSMSERLKRLLRVARERVKAKVAGGVESGAPGAAIVGPPRGLADDSGSGSDVDAEFEVEVPSAVGSACGSMIFQAPAGACPQDPAHPRDNGRQGRGEEGCSSWRMDVDAASSEVALALLSLSTSRGPSCSSSTTFSSLGLDSTTTHAAVIPSSSSKSKVVADYVEYMRTPSVLLLPAPLPPIPSSISDRSQSPSQTDISSHSHSREPYFMSNEVAATSASAYTATTFPSPILHGPPLIVASPDSHDPLHLQEPQCDDPSAIASTIDTVTNPVDCVIGLDYSPVPDGLRLPLVPPAYTMGAEMDPTINPLPSSQGQHAAYSALYPLPGDAQTQARSQTQFISPQIPTQQQSNTHISRRYSHHYQQQQQYTTCSSPSPTATVFSSSTSSTFNRSNSSDYVAFESPGPGIHPAEHAMLHPPVPSTQMTPLTPRAMTAELAESVQPPGPPTTFVNAFVHSPRPGRSPTSSADLRAWAETGHFLASPSLSGSTGIDSDSVASSAPVTVATSLPRQQHLVYLKQQQQQRICASRAHTQGQASSGQSSERDACWERRVSGEAEASAPAWRRPESSLNLHQRQPHRTRHQTTVWPKYSAYGGLVVSNSESMSAAEAISNTHTLHHHHHHRAVASVSSPTSPHKRQPQMLKSTALPSFSMYLPHSSSSHQHSHHHHSPGHSQSVLPSLPPARPLGSATETGMFNLAFPSPLPLEHHDSNRDIMHAAVEQQQHPTYPSTSSFENNIPTIHSKSNCPY